MESERHKQLKRLAMAFALHHGCRAVACEVQCPIARWRVDVAGFVDRKRDASSTLEGTQPDDCHSATASMEQRARTFMIECKQSRTDFLRDQRNRDRLLDIRDKLERIKHAIERDRIPREEPHLRHNGASLFADLEDWDFARSELPAYQRIIKRIERIERALYGETKFFMIAHYRLADFLFIAAPRNIVQQREIPRGWGLIECDHATLDERSADLDLAAHPPVHLCAHSTNALSNTRHRTRLLRNIAVAASRSVIAQHNLLPGLFQRH